MPISMVTALEIFTNPNDIDISVRQEKGSGKYGIEFSRGPEHNFKMLLSSQPFTEKLEDAVKTIKETLETIQQAVAGELDDKKSILSGYLNPDGQSIDQSKVLNSDLIARIVDELRQHQTASTWKMLTVPN